MDFGISKIVTSVCFKYWIDMYDTGVKFYDVDCKDNKSEIWRYENWLLTFRVSELNLK